jgi:hypothetical protein
VKPDVDFEVLKSVLEHLSQKYQLIEDNSSTEQEDVKKDRILTVDINDLFFFFIFIIIFII